GVDSCKIRKKESVHRPVDDSNASDITRAYGKVVVLGGFEKIFKILGVMREITVHFKDIIVFASECAVEASDICSPKAELSFSLNHMNLRIFRLESFYSCGGAVGRAVFN